LMINTIAGILCFIFPHHHPVTEKMFQYVHDLGSKNTSSSSEIWTRDQRSGTRWQVGTSLSLAPPERSRWIPRRMTRSLHKLLADDSLWRSLPKH
jgi:hypothetical protein